MSSILAFSVKSGQDLPMKSDAEAAEVFSQYLKFWMRERGIATPADLVERASRKGAQVSNSKINSILLGVYANHQMRILEAISLAILRPLEEVFQAALGYGPTMVEHPEFKESEFAHLWHLYSQLPAGERKHYKRYVQMLANDIQRVSNKGSE